MRIYWRSISGANYDDSIVVKTYSDSDSNSDEVVEFENNNGLKPRTTREFVQRYLDKSPATPMGYIAEKTDIQVNNSDRINIGTQYHGNRRE